MKIRLDNPLFLTILVIIITSIVVTGTSIIPFYPFKSIDRLIEFGTIMSLIIATLAFLIAMRTYISIDNVNVLTQMDGNVLENEKYVTPITHLLREYDMEDSEEIEDKIFKTLHMKFKRESNTAIEFAKNLQYFIDVIVLFPFLFNSSGKNQKENMKKMDKIIAQMKEKKDGLLAIGSGNLILLEETVMLIDSVISYQKLINLNDHRVNSSILTVRGTMLKNPVAKTVYYNYLGLYYNKKAMYVIRQKLKLENKDIFEIDVLHSVFNKINLLEDEEVELIRLCLDESKRSFNNALENCYNDVMWEGFIKYNDARSSFFMQLILENCKGEEKRVNWCDIMNEAIVARRKQNILIKDILEMNVKNSFLKMMFQYEQFLASLVKINIQIAKQMEITDVGGEIKYKYPDYEGLCNENIIKECYKEMPEKIGNYQRDIINAVRNKNP